MTLRRWRSGINNTGSHRWSAAIGESLLDVVIVLESIQVLEVRQILTKLFEVQNDSVAIQELILSFTELMKFVEIVEEALNIDELVSRAAVTFLKISEALGIEETTLRVGKSLLIVLESIEISWEVIENAFLSKLFTVTETVHIRELAERAQAFFSAASILGYWHSEYGAEAVVGGDVEIDRGSHAWSTDKRGIWRRYVADTLRFTWQRLFGSVITVADMEKAATQLVEHNIGFASGWSLDAHASASLSVVNDEGELEAVGLLNLVPTGQVLLFDTTNVPASAGDQFVVNAGVVEGTDPHAVSVFGRGGGSINLGLQGGSELTWHQLTDTYSRFKDVDPSPGATDQFAVRTKPGSRVYFVLGQLEKGSYATSPIPNPTSEFVSRDSDGALYTNAPLPRQPKPLVYFSFIAKASPMDMEDDTRVWQIGGSGDAWVQKIENDALVTVLKTNEIEYSVRTEFNGIAKAGDFVETATWYEPNGQMYQACLVRGEAVGGVEAGDIAEIPERWSGDGILYVNRDDTGAHRGSFEYVTWKVLKAAHINREEYSEDAVGLMRQIRNIIVGPGGSVKGGSVSA